MIDFNPETMKVKLCKKCKGLGFFLDLKGNTCKCAECNGTGRFIIDTKTEILDMKLLETNDISFDDETMKIKICKECDGKGHFMWGQTECHCEECGGTGRYIEQKFETEYQMHHVELR